MDRVQELEIKRLLDKVHKKLKIDLNVDQYKADDDEDYYVYSVSVNMSGLIVFILEEVDYEYLVGYLNGMIHGYDFAYDVMYKTVCQN